VAPPTHTPTRTPTLPPPPTVPPLPADLIVAGITGPTALVHVGPDLVETYTITISNIGEANSGSFVSSIQLNDADPVDLGSANLNGGESIALNFDMTFEGPGVYTITVIADSGGTVTESLETNNSDTLDVGVVAG
jgi:subtilase family serine protease